MRTARLGLLAIATGIAVVLPAPVAQAAGLEPPAGVTVVVASTNVAFGQGRVTASWSAVTGALGYAVSARSGGVVVSTATVSAPLTSATVTGLTGGVAYDIVVQTANADGFGLASTPVQATALTVPAAPALGTPDTSGGSSTVVSWSEPNNGGSAITSYTVTQTATSTMVSGLTTTSTTFTGTTYGSASDYAVTATNSVGTSATGEATSTTPSAPQSLAATVASGVITATWAAPASTGGAAVTGYTATLSSGGSILSSMSVAGTSTTFPPAAAGPYRVQVTASNSNGAGLPATLAVTVQASGSGESSSAASGGTSAAVPSTPGSAATGSTTGGSPVSAIGATTVLQPAARPTGVLPTTVTANAGAKETIRLSKISNVVTSQLLVRAIPVKGKTVVLKASFIRRGEGVSVTYLSPRKPGKYTLQVMQRTATGLAQVAKTRLVVGA